MQKNLLSVTTQEVCAYLYADVLSWLTSVPSFNKRRGGSPCVTVAPVITHFSMSSREGSSNITSSMMPSMIERSPRAPVLRSIAFLAISESASSSNSSSTLSSSSIFLNCLTRAFFGFVKIATNASSSSFSRLAITGRRPINSGINPKRSKSSGSTFERRSSFSRSAALLSAPNPITFCAKRRLMICSIPSKRPPQMNKIFVVSI
uniref:Uncharacterized protein n=1 Tax=Bacillus subtilis TaxID=1423 RepID=P94570_BACIU|nr:hypothetical protein [Bacillus subtilis]